ncbi:MAG: winged helix-turn-helix domain-containing protein [Actinomycetota bacterium]
MNDLRGVFQALHDPVRRSLIDVLSEGPARSGALAERLQLSTAVISRQLKVLRDHGLVERFDVADDGRGRTYQLRPGALDGMREWLSAQRWAERLPSGEVRPEVAVLQRRIGQFLDAFARNDVAFFETHVSDDAQFVFPDFDRPLHKSDVLAEVIDHPPFTSWEIVGPGRTVALPAGTTLFTSTARTTTTLRTTPDAIHVTVVFAESPDDAWRLCHMQWTRAIELGDLEA